MPVKNSGMKMQLKAMNVPQKWILPERVVHQRPNIFGNQNVMPANMPMIAIGKNV